MLPLHVTRSGLVTPVRPDPTGRTGPTPDQARGRKWRRTSPGLYVPTETKDGLEQRIVEAAAGAPDGAAITGWAALAWQRARWFDGLAPDRSPLPIPLALGDQRTVRPRPGVQLCEDWLFEGDIVDCDGLPITIPPRSVSFEARRAWSFERAVQIVDMAAAADLASLEELAVYALRLRGRPGTVQLNQAIEYGNENVWSLMEVTLRLEWRRPGRHDGPLPLLCNVPVFDLAGNHLFTPDLFDPEWAVAGEYDGAVHDADEPRRRDLDREELAKAHDIELVTMMRGDLRDPHRFHARRKAAYRRAAERPTRRTWTLEQPPWSVDTSTVTARRALDPPARARWLRHQLIPPRT